MKNITSQVTNQVSKNQVGWSAMNQVTNQLWIQVSNKVSGQVSNLVRHQVWLQVLRHHPYE